MVLIKLDFFQPGENGFFCLPLKPANENNLNYRIGLFIYIYVRFLFFKENTYDIFSKTNNPHVIGKRDIRRVILRM